MSAAPWYIYLIGLVVALPCFILLGLCLYGLVRGLLSIVAGAEAEPTKAATPERRTKK